MPLSNFDLRCLREICVRPATSEMELCGRLNGRRGYRRCCMADCWVAIDRLRQAGLVYWTTRGNRAATPAGRGLAKLGKSIERVGKSRMARAAKVAQAEPAS
jgi:hypothetical protein